MQELDSIFLDNQNIEKRGELKNFLQLFIVFSILHTYVDSVVYVKIINGQPNAATHGNLGLAAVSYLAAAFVFDFLGRKKSILSTLIISYLIVLLFPIYDGIMQYNVETFPFFGTVATCIRSAMIAFFSGVILSCNTKNDFYLKIHILVSSLSAFLPELNTLFYRFISPEYDRGAMLIILMVLCAPFFYFPLKKEIRYPLTLTKPLKEKFNRMFLISASSCLLFVFILILFRSSFDKFGFFYFQGLQSSSFFYPAFLSIFLLPLLILFIISILPFKINPLAFFVPGSVGLLIVLTLVYFNAYKNTGNDQSFGNPIYYNVIFTVSGLLLQFGCYIQLIKLSPRRYITIVSGIFSVSYLALKLFEKAFPSFYSLPMQESKFIFLYLVLIGALGFIFIIQFQLGRKKE